MAPTVNVLKTFIKTAAVSGIAFFWVNFTAESLKLAWHIIFLILKLGSPSSKKSCAKAAMVIF